ncbi:conjugal transfer protein TrbE [Emcibacter nanhaiensis]|uniref:DUF853 family protein n=1 Tax=Emcibacter nanhaiensis TaxID=1505037 RepID=A0A501PGV2_9PROT|nr:conjugal transfer protein TrbE [Emcibacter nanhaiensis]TPD59308.1 DUF853 family protein [Emcibacter nanhaiensis]
MLNLREYQNKTACLADHLPWAGLVHPSVVLNKDGSFMRCAELRGPDLQDMETGEVIAFHARVNDALKRLGSGWALFLDNRRIAARSYPTSEFPDPVSALVEEERRAEFAGGEHFENRLCLALLWMPPEDRTDKVTGLFLSRKDGEGNGASLSKPERHLEKFLRHSDRIFGLLEDVVPEFDVLEKGNLLTYLHGTVSTKSHKISLPEVPFYLDAILTDDTLSGGISPRLGEQYLKLVTLTGYPGSSLPGLLGGLDGLGFEYRHVSRFLALDKEEALKELNKYRRQWFSKRKSLANILKEVMTNEASQLLDRDAENKARDVEEALQELGGDYVSYGHLTVTIMVSDPSEDVAEEKIMAVERVLGSSGFVAIRERVNAVEAWLGSLPGHVYANLRKAMISSLNLAHLLPLSSPWAGPVRNAHLQGPPLLIAETDSLTPFRLVQHIGDVGHMMVVGPTGAGKSVLLSLMCLQFRRYPKANICFFDKGASCKAAILAMGGEFHEPGAGRQAGFQPLARIDEECWCLWAGDWIALVLEAQGVKLEPCHKEQIWSALNSLASAPRKERTLTGLVLLLQDEDLRQGLKPYTLEGAYGHLLDSDAETLEPGPLQAFEMEELMEQPAAVLPVLSYLFRRLEEVFSTDGPTLLVLDEAWLFLDHPAFAGKIREWLKVLRKKNVSVVFATQSLSDIAESSISPVLTESCPGRIFLANPRAAEPRLLDIYKAFGLSERQIEVISRSSPKRDYYLQTPVGCRLFQLGLGPLALSLVAASSPEDRSMITAVSNECGSETFGAGWLRARGFPWAADLIEQYGPDTSRRNDDGKT